MNTGSKFRHKDLVHVTTTLYEEQYLTGKKSSSIKGKKAQLYKVKNQYMFLKCLFAFESNLQKLARSFLKMKITQSKTF